ncbi:hypothetical protein ABPG72_022604 [Tetrahymena utriculariae]
MQQSEPQKSKQLQNQQILSQNNGQQGGLQVVGRNFGSQNEQQQQYEDIFNEDDSMLFNKQQQQQMQQKRGFQMQKQAQDFYSSSHAQAPINQQNMQNMPQQKNKFNFQPTINYQQSLPQLQQLNQKQQQYYQQQQQQQQHILPQQQPQVNSFQPQQNQILYNNILNLNQNQVPLPPPRQFPINFNQNNNNNNNIAPPPKISFNQLTSPPQNNQYHAQSPPQTFLNDIKPPSPPKFNFAQPSQSQNQTYWQQQNNQQSFYGLNNNLNNSFFNNTQRNNYNQNNQNNSYNQNNFNYQQQQNIQTPFELPKDPSLSTQNKDKLPIIGNIQNRFQQGEFQQDYIKEGSYQQLAREGYLSQHPLFKKHKDDQRNKILSSTEEFDDNEFLERNDQNLDFLDRNINIQKLDKQRQNEKKSIIQEPLLNKETKSIQHLNIQKQNENQLFLSKRSSQLINQNLNFRQSFEESDQSQSRSESRGMQKEQQRDPSRKRDRSRLGEKKKKKEKAKKTETLPDENKQQLEAQIPLQIAANQLKITPKQIQMPLLKEQSQKRETLQSQKALRTMKDIQGESLRTSYCFQAQSFKWTSKIKSFSQTIKKGNQMNEIIQRQKQIQIQNKSNNQAKFDGHLSLIPEFDEIEISKQRLVSKSLVNTDISTNPISQDKILIFNNSTMDLQASTSQLGNIFASVDNYASQITLFKQKLAIIQQNGQTPNIQFYFHSNIDNGSFGKVDLYFFNQNNLNLQVIAPLEQPFNSQKIQITPGTSSYGAQLSEIQVSQEMKFDGIMQLNSSQLKSNIFLSQKQQSEQSSRSSSNNFSTQESTSQLNSQGTFLSSTQREKISLLISSQQKQATDILPAAGKKIKKQDEFIRELFIMQTFQSQYMPSLFGQDIDQQILFMELGLCNLFSLKQDSINNNYRFSDEFTYQALLNIINAIESFLSFRDPQSGECKPMFHSDIKPQNIILTVKKENNLQNTQIQLLLIDYGGASLEIEDYWTYYTPAFVSNKLWSKFVNDQNYQEKLQWEEIRFAEVFAACRSIQYIIVEKDKQYLFKKDSTLQFMKEYWQLYPRTTRLISTIYQLEQKGRIDSNYKGIFNQDEISSSRFINPQKIVFEAQKIFELSKLNNNFNLNQLENI